MSTSAVRRAEPYNKAACAPKTYQPSPSASQTRFRSARSATNGEGLRGTIEEKFQLNVMVEVVSRVLCIREARLHSARVCVKGMAGLQSGQRRAFLRCRRPILSLELLDGLSLSSNELPDIAR